MTEQDIIIKVMSDLQEAIKVSSNVCYNYDDESDFTTLPAYIIGHSQGTMSNAIIELSKLIDI